MPGMTDTSHRHEVASGDRSIIASMTAHDDLAAWHRQLRRILDSVADATRALGIARGAGGISDAIQDAADSRAEDVIERIAKLVRQANQLAEQIHAADPATGPIVHPLLGVPGDKPEVDLRPWWSRLLDKISSTAVRASVAERLETLRLEADAALIRASAHSRHVRCPAPNHDDGS